MPPDRFKNGHVFDEADFINLSERSGTPANDAKKVLKLEDDGYLSSQWLKFLRQLSTFENIDGSTTPVAVGINTSVYWICSLGQ